MTIEEARCRLRRASYCIFQISKELDRIDELWRRLCSPNGPRWSDEMRSTIPSSFMNLMMDLISQREKDAAEAYSYVREVEKELILLGQSHFHEARALDMRFIKGLRYREIGTILGYTKDGAYSLVQRALAFYAKEQTKTNFLLCQ